MKRKLWLISISLTVVFLILIGIYIYRLKCIDSVELGYAGAIIGGSMTLVGVSWSIRDMKLQRSEDIKNKYLPIPIISECKNTNVSIDNNILTLEFELEVKNIGNGPLLKIQFDNINPYFSLVGDNLFVPTEYGFGFPFSLNKNETFTLYFPKIKIKLEGNEFLYFTHFQYVDAFDRKYDFYLKTEITCQFDDEGELLSYDTEPKCYQIKKSDYEYYKKTG